MMLFMLKQQNYTLTKFRKVKSYFTTPLSNPFKKKSESDFLKHFLAWFRYFFYIYSLFH